MHTDGVWGTTHFLAFLSIEEEYEKHVVLHAVSASTMPYCIRFEQTLFAKIDRALRKDGVAWSEITLIP
tara:strand:+ start:3374 stop:3580 length:207 start_codon:yes stop_codon:yes gene_type:complete